MTPAELLLAAQGGCTAFDVVSILAKKRQAVTSYDVVTGEQRDEPYPHVYQKIDVLHELSGPVLDTLAVRRAIELSATRYCTATAKLSAGPAETHHRHFVGPAESGEVVVAGPRADPHALGAQRVATVAAAAGRGGADDGGQVRTVAGG